MTGLPTGVLIDRRTLKETSRSFTNKKKKEKIGTVPSHPLGSSEDSPQGLNGVNVIFAVLSVTGLNLCVTISDL